ncbi:hypothetical protein [Micromonospora sp. NPDC005367]|uniref:hypothetical protein n=1 Tax=Micromonospora sp. NPDC005367 TaxID=3155590 RepID=UPI0033AEE67E
MTAPQQSERPRAAVIAAGGAFLPAHVCEPVWRVLRTAIDRQRADGYQIRPEIADALDALRAAAVAHLTDMSAHGRDLRTSEDLDASSPSPALLTTAALAIRLGVTERHARRIATAEGIQPAARNAWHREDVTALVARRS